MTNKDRNDELWKEQFTSFSQSTTFHGLPYITDRNSPTCRRVIWFLLFVSALVGFVSLVVMQIIHLAGLPRAVDVEINYKEVMAFPSVTICNQNVFRKTAASQYGLYDTIVASFGGTSSTKDAGTSEESKDLDGSFEITQDHYLSGIGGTYTMYSGIPQQVCKQVCVELHSDDCCSLVYILQSSNCFITPFESSASGVSLKPKAGVTYLKRTKCSLKTEASCTFDDGTLCSFVQDADQKLTWAVTSGSTIPQTTADDLYSPRTDYSTGTENGSYIFATLPYFLPDLSAKLMSPYLLADDNKCLQLHYQVFGGTLAVTLGYPGSGNKRIWKVNRIADVPDGAWEYVNIKLPQGYYRVYVEAFAPSPTDKVKVAVDDVIIGNCTEVKLCKYTSRGYGYKGGMASSASGNPCQSWSDIAYLPSFWQIPHGSLDEMGNLCRNPDGDIKGPWCLTEVRSGRKEYCEIGFCECSNSSIRCNTGACIDRSYVCDGIKHCTDGSDELDCDNPFNGTCVFSRDEHCGYVIPEQYIIPETTESLELNLKDLRPNKTFQIISPTFQLENTSCLEIRLRLLAIHVDFGIISEQNPLKANMTFIGSLESNEFITQNMTMVFGNMTLSKHNVSLVISVVSLVMDEARYLDVQHVIIHNQDCSAVVDDYLLTLLPPVTTPEMPNETTILFLNQTSTTNIPTDFTSTMIENKTEDNATTSEWATSPVTENNFTDSGRRNRRDIELTTISNFGNVENSSPSYNNFTLNFDGNGTMIWENVTNSNWTFAGTTDVPFFIDIPDYLVLDYNFSTCLSCGYNVAPILDNITCMTDPYNCTFDDGCSCGYTIFSDNLQLHWQMYPPLVHYNPGINGTNQTAEEAGFTYEPQILLPRHLSIVGSSLIGDTITLASRPIEISQPSCLKFIYQVRYSLLLVKLLRATTTETVLEIRDDGHAKEWHQAYVKIDPGDVRIVFEAVAKGNMDNNTAIDDVVVTSGSCYREPKFPSVTCEFDDYNLCGYQDITHEVGERMEWFQKKEHNEDSPGGYFIHTTTSGIGKISRRLKSPSIRIDEDSCLTFYYKFQVSNQREMASFAVYSMNKFPDNGTAQNEIVWLVRQVSTPVWMWASVDITPGEYNFLFEINGDKVKASLDDISIRNEACSNHTCKMKEFLCQDFDFARACVPNDTLCNGIPQCWQGDDEHFTICDRNPQPNPTETGDDSELHTDNGNENNNGENIPINKVKLYKDIMKKDTSRNVQSLYEMFSDLGHQMDDFIYKCTWGNTECGKEDFKQEVTDYGLCYTFNYNGSHNLQTAGSSTGLALTLNIEQYEYMVGPNVDAGIKVSLHKSGDVPRVKDLGFSVAPGTHTLAGTMVTEVSNLPPPYGECGEQELHLYPKYTLAACNTQCDTDLLAEKCSCRAAYMRNDTNGEPRECSLDEYFDCVVTTVYVNRTLAFGSCPCIKPCEDILYEGSLSYAGLSSDSVDFILNKNIDTLRKKFDSATNIGQRLDRFTFVDDLAVVKDAQDLYEELLGFVDRYLGQAENSTMAKFAEIAVVMGDVFNQDMGVLFQTIDPMKEIYSLVYLDSVLLLNREMDQLALYCMETRLLFKERSLLSSTNLASPSFIKRASEVTEIIDNVFSYMTVLFNDDNFVEEVLNASISFLPEDYAVDDAFKALPNVLYYSEDCIATQKTIAAAVHHLRKMFSGLNEAKNTKDLVKAMGIYQNEMLRNITSFLALEETYKLCLSTYANVLDDITSWFQTSTAAMQSSLQYKYNYNFQSQSKLIIDDLNSVKLALRRYVENEITKLDFLKSAANSDSAISTLKTFLEQVKSTVSTPLITSIQEATSLLQGFYVESLLKSGKLETYLTQGYFYEYVKQMVIWSGPLPSSNLENTAEYRTGGTELWTIWNQDSKQSLEEFATSQKFTETAIENYFAPILVEYRSFEQQLNSHEEKLTRVLEKIIATHEIYDEARAIDNVFIQNNFLRLDIYFKELQYQSVKQVRAYGVGDFFSDLGGIIGLLMGASVLSVLEIFDFFIYTAFLKRKNKKQQMYGQQDSEKAPESTNGKTEVGFANTAYDAGFSDTATRRNIDGNNDYG